MFDREATTELHGTVKELQWTNPHVWLQLEVVAGGQPVIYSLEAQSPNLLVRRGWIHDSIVAGQTVQVTFHPLKDGTNGGQLVEVIRADGKRFATAY